MTQPIDSAMLEHARHAADTVFASPEYPQDANDAIRHRYVLLKEVDRLTGALADAQHDLKKLSALQRAGVDSWDGYEYAMESLRNGDDD